MRGLILRTIGSFAIFAVFFFGTLYILGYETSDEARVRQVHAIKNAMERYRAARGVYPSPFGDSPLSALRKELVDSSYLQSIPSDPVSGKEYRYVSYNGKTYGLLAPIGCLTGVGTAKTGWWAQPPDCPY